jgi:hypothetical protein
MSYNVLTIAPFDRQLKRLAKKIPSLKTEFASLIEELEQNPTKGIPLGNNCFKIRLAIAWICSKRTKWPVRIAKKIGSIEKYRIFAPIVPRTLPVRTAHPAGTSSFITILTVNALY